MDIFNSQRRWLRCIRNDDSLALGVSGCGYLLTIGTLYKLKKIEARRWYTIVTLEEFPDLQFSSILFEEVTGEKGLDLLERDDVL